MATYLIYAIGIVFVLFVLSRTKEVDKVNKRAIEEASNLRRETLEIQKEILEELKAIRNERKE
jgi:Na+/melibiose symporter-like transporter